MATKKLLTVCASIAGLPVFVSRRQAFIIALTAVTLAVSSEQA